MDTTEDKTTSSFPRLQSYEPGLGFTVLPVPDSESEQTLISKFENVSIGLEEIKHPLRPHAEDCQYYMKTGTCKFELNCKFNHPVRRPNQVGKDNDREESSEKSGLIECKYYLTPGGCKYGNSCRYNHSRDESEIALAELNFLGLPIRVGEKECPFYMRSGSCGYGAQCRFHHPEPTAVGGSDLHSSISNDESVGQFGASSGNLNGESIPLRLSGPPQSQFSRSSHMASNKTFPLQNSWSFGERAAPSLTQGAYPNYGNNMYQAPKYPDEMIRYPRPSPGKSLTTNPYVGTNVDEFPERPGQPECDHFMRTGDCKFKSACKYHHPKSRAPRADICVLSEKGLPLRPGRKICWHYEQTGVCKYGQSCLFDHPVNHGPSTFPTGTISETSYDNNNYGTQGWEL